jgi:hypothetical protein
MFHPTEVLGEKGFEIVWLCRVGTRYFGRLPMYE